MSQYKLYTVLIVVFFFMLVNKFESESTGLSHCV